MTGQQIIALVYGGLMLAFFIVFIIGLFRHRRRVRVYTRYGLLLAAAVLGLDTVILVMNSAALTAASPAALVCIDVLVFTKIAVFGVVGMYCAATLRLPHVPLLRGVLGRRWPGHPGQARGLLVWAPVLALLGVCYSSILFTLVPVHVSPVLLQALGTTADDAGAVSLQPTLLSALVMLEFALTEEVVFRLGIQSYLAKLFKLRGNRYWMAIVPVAVLWSMAHVNTLDPYWVKVAQVLPFGLALGALFRRYGLEATMLAHAAFNLVLLLLAPYLIQV